MKKVKKIFKMKILKFRTNLMGNQIFACLFSTQLHRLFLIKEYLNSPCFKDIMVGDVIKNVFVVFLSQPEIYNIFNEYNFWHEKCIDFKKCDGDKFAKKLSCDKIAYKINMDINDDDIYKLVKNIATYVQFDKLMHILVSALCIMFEYKNFVEDIFLTKKSITNIDCCLILNDIIAHINYVNDDYSINMFNFGSLLIDNIKGSVEIDEYKCRELKNFKSASKSLTNIFDLIINYYEYVWEDNIFDIKINNTSIFGDKRFF